MQNGDVVADRGDTAYRSLTIYYQSGTGNTLRVAQWLAETAAAQGAETQLGPIEDAKPREELRLGDGHLLALLMPAHGFTAPWSMIRFAACLPRGHGTHALVSSTRAGTKLGPLFFCGMEGTAIYLIALILALRGYRVRGARGIDMPSNWLSLHPGFSEPAARAIIARSRPHALRFFNRILAGRRWYGSLICLAQGILLAPVSLGYLLMGRFWLAKLFFASTRCDGCGVCAAKCPRSAIHMTGGNQRPYWTFECESCMRCMSYCPRKAVDVNYALAILLVLIPAHLFTALGASRIEGTVGKWGLWIVEYPIYLATYWAGYMVMHQLNFLKPVHWLMSWSTPTRFYRRSHEPDTRLAQISAHGTRKTGSG